MGALAVLLADLRCGSRNPLRVAADKEESADDEAYGGPRGEDAESGPGVDHEVVEIYGVLDGEPGVHWADLIQVSLPVGVGDGIGEYREEVQDAEDGPDRRGGVAHGGGGSETEQGDQGEVENRAGGGAQCGGVGQGDCRVAVGGGEPMAVEDD